MSVQEYRICVSDSPARLASEVTALLAQGWELYGHPFAGKQNPATGNGDRGVCQAMVKRTGQVSALESPAATVAPVAPPETIPRKAEEEHPAPIRPKRPRFVFTYRRAAIVVAVLIAGVFLFDAIVFRSGYYARFLDPLSSTGTFERVLDAESHRPVVKGRKEILVLGSARVAEGFSAKIANEYKGKDGYWFANCSFPDNAARAWYYFVRDVDPDRNRYAAIAVPIDDYDDPEGLEDPADSKPDLTLLINRLGFMDILPFTMSFKSWGRRFQVLRGTLLKGPVFLPDYRAYRKNPVERLNSAKAWREHGSDWVYFYEGNQGSLAGISVDWTARRVSYPPGMPEGQQQELAREIFAEPRQHGFTRDYQVRWLGALTDLYGHSQTRIIVFQTPRSPAPRPTPLAQLSPATVDELRKRPSVTVLDRHAFDSVEKPELFFSYWHLNAQGRKVFSPMLADAIKECVK